MPLKIRHKVMVLSSQTKGKKKVKGTKWLIVVEFFANRTHLCNRINQGTPIFSCSWQGRFIERVSGAVLALKAAGVTEAP